MSTPYPQQPAGQPAVPAQPAQPAQPAYQGVPQAAVPAQPAAPAQPAPQGYSAASQGFAPGYAPVPEGPVKVRVNYISLVFGICVWVFIALLVLDAWRLMHSPDVSASGKAIVGFYPLFVLAIGGPLNLIGVIVGSSRAKEKPRNGSSTGWELSSMRARTSSVSVFSLSRTSPWLWRSFSRRPLVHAQ